MKKVNLIVVFNKNQDQILFCKRTSDPYKNLYNFVGGKVEEDEDERHAAYRELFEETGISNEDISLVHMMDYVYPLDSLTMNIYYGVLNKEKDLIEEKHPLIFLDKETNFMDERFAGDGNVHHMATLAKYYLKHKDQYNKI